MTMAITSIKENTDHLIFGNYAQRYYDQGYNIIPLTRGEKRPVPGLTNWSQYSTTRVPEETLKEWIAQYPDSNIGLLTGPISGLVALDFDEDVAGLHDKIQKISGPSAVYKKGSRGATSFFKYNGEKTAKFAKDGKMVLELLSTGRYTVLPPSLHPDGCAYRYKDKTLLDDVTFGYLPTNFIHEVGVLFGLEQPAPISESQETVKPSLDAVISALTYLDAGDYEQWLQIGMGLKNEFGDDGFKVWDDWSKSDSKYDARICQYKWDSFKKAGISAGTIFHLAAKNGFRFRNTMLETDGDETGAIVSDTGSVLDTLSTWRQRGKPTGTKCGIDSLDNLFRWRKGEFTVVTGFPGSGKSEFIEYLMYKHFETNGSKFMLASFESADPATHIDTFLHRMSGRPFELRTDKEDIDLLNRIKDNLVLYASEVSSHQIDVILKFAKTINGLDFLVIDPFNYLMSPYTDNVYYNVRYICKAIKCFAKETGVHVLLIAHPRTTKERKKDGTLAKVNIWDIAGGYDFWNMSDNGIAVHRDVEGVSVEFQKVKRQDIDRLGQVTLTFDKETRQYSEANYADEF